MNITQDLVCQPTLVGPDHANQMRSTMYFERQRDMNEANIARLVHEMEMGRFIPGTQVYIAVLPGGKMLLLNGNHTLQAIIRCRLPQLLDLAYKQVPNMDAAGRIYAVFDLHKLGHGVIAFAALERRTSFQIRPMPCLLLELLTRALHKGQCEVQSVGSSAWSLWSNIK